MEKVFIDCDFVPFAQFQKRKENNHGGMLLLVKLQASTCNFTKSSTPTWVLLTNFKSYKWYQIAESVKKSFIIGI